MSLLMIIQFMFSIRSLVSADLVVADLEDLRVGDRLRPARHGVVLPADDDDAREARAQPGVAPGVVPVLMRTSTPNARSVPKIRFHRIR